MNQFPYGAVFKVQREYALDEIFSNLKSMKDLGMNIVVIWPAVYWWEDKGLPNYPYNTGHEILKYAEKIGMKVIMELAGQITALEYVPDFVMKEEYYPITYEGFLEKDKLYYGYLNYFHPEVKQLIKKQFTEIAENYKGYSSLYGYDIWNETMFMSFDQYTLQVFREWLKKKYNSINRLNDVWDRAYHDWSQIQFTRWMWASVMPKVDYHQFQKDSVGMVLNEWYKTVKDVDPHHPIIADNVSSMVVEDQSYERPQDDWNVAENVDEFGTSFYPKNAPNIMPDYKRWEILVGIHSATPTGRFWISELQSHLQMMFNPLSVVYPHEIAWWNWEAVSHGAKGVIYWMWNPFIKGMQTFGRGLVDTRLQYTDRAQTARMIGNVLKENEREFLTYEPKMPKAAILFDKINHDFTRAYTEQYTPFINNAIYIDSIAGIFKCMWENNIPTKFITQKEIMNGTVKQYKVLFMTNQLNISNEFSDALKEYVANGGVLICDGKFGEIDDFGVLHRNMPGGKLNEILGYRHVDVDPNGLVIDIKLNQNNEFKLDGYYEKRILEITDENVDVIGTFENGLPAVIKTSIGKGMVIYIPTHLWYGFYKENFESVSHFMRLLKDEYKLSPYSISNNDVKVCLLKGEDGMILFAFNYKNKEASAQIQLNDISPKFTTCKKIFGKEQDRGMIADENTLNIIVKAQDVSIFKLNY